jgi:hypothetical protein
MSIRPAQVPRGDAESDRPADPPPNGGRRPPSAGTTAPPGKPPATRVQGRPTRATRRGTYDDRTGRSRRRGSAPPPVEIRRVRRVVRRVDTWTVFRFSAVLYVCGLFVFMASVVGLWVVASSAGAIPSIQNFITQLFALKNFKFKAGQLFLATFAIGVICVFAATLFTVITAVLYNLISDVVGGVEVTMLEEEPIEVGPAPTRAAAPPATRPTPAPGP